MNDVLAVQNSEHEVIFHLEQAGKIGQQELMADLDANRIHTKSWHIRKAAEAAEMAGWPKHEIANRLWKIIEKKGFNLTRRLIQLVCSPLGYVDDSQARHVSDEIISSENSSLLDVPESNKDVIYVYNQLITFFQDFCESVKTCSIDPVALEGWQEHKYVIQSLIETAYEARDGRQSVLTVQQLQLMDLIAAYGPAAAATIFQRSKEITLTPKQATKYRHGEVRRLLPIYDPKTRDEAVAVGFYGHRCQCGSWRVKPAKEGVEFKLHCFACLSTFEPVTLRLPTAQGVELDKKIDAVMANYEQWKKENGIGND